MRKKKINYRLIWGILLWITFTNGLVFSEEETIIEDKNKFKEAVIQSNTIIESDYLKMETTENCHVFRFSNNIEVKGGGIHLTCNQLEVFSNKSNDKENKSRDSVDSGLDNIGEIEHIVATGDVVIIQDDKKALADRAEIFRKFDSTSGEKINKIILTGNPRVINEQGTVNGSRIILIPEEDKVLIESDKEGKQRPTIILNELEVNPIK